MFRHLTRSALIAAAVVVASLMADSPAKAIVVDPVRSPFWITAGCATAELTSPSRDPHGPAVVFGNASPCSKHIEQSSFALAVYHLDKPGADPFALLDAARFYRNGKPRAFGIGVFGAGRHEAVCLVAGPTHRLACAMMSISAEGGPVTMEPLATNDPSVSRAVKFGRHDPTMPGGPSPACATCF